MKVFFLILMVSKTLEAVRSAKKAAGKSFLEK